MKKRMISLILTVAMLMQLCSMTVVAAGTRVAYGTCGDNLTYELMSDGVLTISGTGDMTDYDINTQAPWEKYRSQIKKVVLENSVTSIGDYAFMWCPNLSSVKFGSGVTEIGTYAFSVCNKLTELELPESLKTIRKAAFNSCTALSSVTIPDGVETIEDCAFMYCEGLKTVTIGKAVSSIGIGAFEGCMMLNEFQVEEGNTTYSVKDGVLFNAEQTVLMMYPAGKAGAYTVPDGVTQIAAAAFQCCSGLTSVVISNSVQSIGESSFENCENLAFVQIGTGVKAIGDYAFMCSGYGASETGDPVVQFMGDAPAFEKSEYNDDLMARTFYESAYVCLYPAGNDTWTEDKLLENVEWIAVENSGGEGEAPDTPEEPVTSLIQNAACKVYDTDYIAKHGKVQLGDGTTTSVFNYINANAGVKYVLRWYCADENVSYFTVRQGGTPIAAGANIAATAADGWYSYSIKETDIATGTAAMPYAINAFDSAGEMLGAAAVTPEADTSAPQVSDFAGAIQEDGSISLTWTKDEEEPAFVIFFLDADKDGYGDYTETIIDFDEKYAGTECSYTISKYSALTYNLTAGTELSMMIIDAVGNEESYTCTLTEADSDIVEPDTTAPAISDVWPATADQVTLCHNGTLQIAATDNVGLARAEVWYMNGTEEVLIGTAEMSGTSQVASVAWDCAALSGKVNLLYRVYDEAGNCAEETAEVTVRAYAAPKVPGGLTAEDGFRSTTLNWSYTGDLQTLKQFRVYSCDVSGENRVLLANVKNYQYTVGNLEGGTCHFLVTAEDIYGAESTGALISASPVTTENEAPVAVIQTAELSGVTGTAITFSGAGSTDNDVIASYVWDFGDGTTGSGINGTHTYNNAGRYTVTLTVTDRSGNRNTTTATVTVYNTLGADATHAVLTVSVMDGYVSGTPGVKNATVTVYNDAGFEIAALTDNDGRAVLVVPKGAHTITVVANGYGAKIQQIEVSGDENGCDFRSVYLAAAGVDVVGGELKVESMTYDQIVEAGIDVTDPANNHVVKNSFEMRFQATPELAFDLDLDVMINAAGELVNGTGFGWHSFEIEDPDPTPGNPDRPNIVVPEDWVTPNYTVGVFPVGESAFMVIHGQTHWLKEMFNVELIVYNNSYAQDITNCVATLELPEGLSLANMLNGSQYEEISIGTIEYIDKEIGGVKVGSPTRQVNWYVRGDSEGEYSLTAAVTGKVSDVPFEKTFTADKAIQVYAGSALKLTVTLPKSAYYDKEYVVNFQLENVSDRPIYNLTFGLDTAQQFTAEYLSNGETGQIREELDNADFENKMTYGVPVLEPGDVFNVVFKTKFLYEQGFVEWAVGMVPIAEVGYRVADIFVTTLEGSTTEIPVEIVMEPVEKSDFLQWIWDETLKKLVENTKDAVIEFIDDKVFKGIPIVETGVKIFEIGGDIKDELEGPETEYTAMVSVSKGVKCVEPEAASAAVSTFGLRRSVQPGVLVWTDAEQYEISADGATLKLLSPGKLYILRNGETVDENGNAVEPEINVTSHYIDSDGQVQAFTRTLLAAEGMDESGNMTGGNYISGLRDAVEIVLEAPEEDALAVPAEGETASVTFPAYMITVDGEIVTRAANTAWSVVDANGKEVTEGLALVDGVLMVDDTAKAGIYTVKLSLNGTDKAVEQIVTLTGQAEPNDPDDPDAPNDPDQPDNDKPGGGGNPGSGEKPGDDVLEDDDKPEDKPVSGNKPGSSTHEKADDEEDAETAELPFADVHTDDWFFDSVRYVYQNGLMNGTDATSFNPCVTTSRGMIVAILWRLEGQPEPQNASVFDDVANGAYYEKAIAWAAENGIVNGYDSTAFKPDADITREQMASVLWRYAKYKGYDVSVGMDTNILSYNDAIDISEYAIPAIRWACGAGIINGKGEGNLDPTGSAIRAEVATILRRFCE